MAKKEVEFKWYVLNEDFGGNYYSEDNPFKRGPWYISSYKPRQIVPWNIFNNTHVYEGTIKLCKDFKSKKMTFEEFTEELRKIIMWQEWSRCEYEIEVGPHFEDNPDNFRKVDCYMQVFPNLEILAKYVLTTYYPRIKI